MVCISSFLILLLVDLGGETLEVSDGDIGEDGIEALALATALGGLSNLAGDENADAAGNALDATVPEEVIEGGVDAVVLGLEELGGDGLELLDGDGGALVEGAGLQVLGQVDGGLDGEVIGLAAIALELGVAGDTAAATVLLGVAGATVLSLLLLRHLGEGLLPLLVVAVAAGLGGLPAGGDELLLGLLSHVLAGGADHPIFLAIASKE